MDDYGMIDWDLEDEKEKKRKKTSEMKSVGKRASWMMSIRKPSPIVEFTKERGPGLEFVGRRCWTKYLWILRMPEGGSTVSPNIWMNVSLYS